MRADLDDKRTELKTEYDNIDEKYKVELIKVKVGFYCSRVGVVETDADAGQADGRGREPGPREVRQGARYVSTFLLHFRCW